MRLFLIFLIFEQILLSIQALVIQKVYRSLSSRRLYKALKESQKELRAAMAHGVTLNEMHYNALEAAVLKADLLRIKLKELQNAKDRYSLMTKQKNIRIELKALITPNLSEKKLTATLKRADALDMQSFNDPVYNLASKALLSISERIQAKKMLKNGCAGKIEKIEKNSEKLKMLRSQCFCFWITTFTILVVIIVILLFS